MSDRRLIEVAFPLEQASIDSVHEKNVRHGHISTLHIWPARRPLAASRAALVATLLRDPGTPEKRLELCERLGGRVEKVLQRKRGPGTKGDERIVRETVGGILHWGRERENEPALALFREEIRRAYGGRRPRVLDPFAGGGAIPLEAMRLGCEVTASDINPVAWFILKCTLEYPQRLAGQRRPLPEFVHGDRDFMEGFFKARGLKGAMLRTQIRKLELGGTDRANERGQNSLDLDVASVSLDGDLAWHVRAWGWRVLREAGRKLAKYYPLYADWQPLKDIKDWRSRNPDAQQPTRLVPCQDDGTPNIEGLNETLTSDELADDRRPRWVAKPTVAYLWARTVTCKNCRATIPLLKTRWLAKKEGKRVLLTVEPNADKTGVVFGVLSDVPAVGGNNAQKREHDRRIGQGTMSRAGAWCPCCGRPGTVAMQMEDIRAEGVSGRLSTAMTAVVTDGPQGKEYRPPTDHELSCAAVSESALASAFDGVPFGILDEPTPAGGGTGAGRAFSVQGYGMMHWRDLFTNRQLLAGGEFAQVIRSMSEEMQTCGYEPEWRVAVVSYLALMLDRLLNQSSNIARWNLGGEKIEGTFARFALPIMWDCAEVNPLSDTSGAFASASEWVSLVVSHLLLATQDSPAPTVTNESALRVSGDRRYDLVLTDPPYYDAIPYSDLMDFFYIWLRRSLNGLSPEYDAAFARSVSPKWDHSAADGELIDDCSRHGGDAGESKRIYEDGMARVFTACASALVEDGRMVVVFANKQPDAWETLVAAMIRSGFTVDGSWPIQTERAARTRSLASAALAASVWLVCRRRSVSARAGWDNTVLEEMRNSIKAHLREFWDAGIRGPDFVWAATGPALEAYSKHPVVKKANDPGKTMGVDEFLRAVRRLVVEFVVGRVLGEALHQAGDAGIQVAAGLDDITTYYLLHRHDFGMNDAPAGACILYALSCNLREGDLSTRYTVLVRSGGVDQDDDGEPDSGDPDAEGETVEGTGSTFKLRPWRQRRRQGLGTEPVALNGSGKTVPLIDMIHHLMHLWVDGDVVRVNEYIDEQGLRRSDVFLQVLQALVELADEGSDERSVLERIMNHLQTRGQAAATLLDTVGRD